MASKLRANFLHMIQRRRHQHLNFYNGDRQVTDEFTNYYTEDNTLCMKDSFEQNEEKVNKIEKILFC